MTSLDVGAWRSGTAAKPGGYGIRLLSADRKFFERRWTWIDVEVSGTRHRFNITPGFWNKCPEFRDNEHHPLRQWIQQFHWKKGTPPRFALVAVGPQHFRLLSKEAADLLRPSQVSRTP
jgi:hypothetical protein